MRGMRRAKCAGNSSRDSTLRRTGEPLRQSSRYWGGGGGVQTADHGEGFIGIGFIKCICIFKASNARGTEPG